MVLDYGGFAIRMSMQQSYLMISKIPNREIGS